MPTHATQNVSTYTTESSSAVIKHMADVLNPQGRSTSLVTWLHSHLLIWVQGQLSWAQLFSLGQNLVSHFQQLSLSVSLLCLLFLSETCTINSWDPNKLHSKWQKIPKIDITLYMYVYHICLFEIEDQCVSVQTPEAHQCRCHFCMKYLAMHDSLSPLSFWNRKFLKAAVIWLLKLFEYMFSYMNHMSTRSS